MRVYNEREIIYIYIYIYIYLYYVTALLEELIKDLYLRIVFNLSSENEVFIFF